MLASHHTKSVINLYFRTKNFKKNFNKFDLDVTLKNSIIFSVILLTIMLIVDTILREWKTVVYKFETMGFHYFLILGIGTYLFYILLVLVIVAIMALISFAVIKIEKGISDYYETYKLTLIYFTVVLFLSFIASVFEFFLASNPVVLVLIQAIIFGFMLWSTFIHMKSLAALHKVTEWLAFLSFIAIIIVTVPIIVALPLGI